MSWKPLFFPLLFYVLPRTSRCEWNKTYITQQLQQLCPYSNICNREGQLPAATPCCTDCSCDSECGKNISCCFDSDDTYHVKEDLVCTSTKPTVPWESDLKAPSYLMVNTCPYERVESENGRKCLMNDDTILGTLWPVYSPTKKRIYKNIYCAQCNDVDSVHHSWMIYVWCNSIIVHAEDFSFEKIHLQSNPGECDVALVPPQNVHLEFLKCSPISFCNQTGLWDSYDPNLEDACNSTNSVYERYEGPLKRYISYSNVFCSKCNRPIADTTHKYSCPQANKTVYKSSIISPVRFSALINFAQDMTVDTSESTDEQKVCIANDIVQRYEVNCSRIICPSSQYSKNRRCFPKIVTFEKSNFNVILQLNNPTDDAIVSSDDILVLKEKVVKILENKAHYGICHASFLVKASNSFSLYIKSPFLIFLTLELNANLRADVIYDLITELTSRSVFVTAKGKQIEMTIRMYHKTYSAFSRVYVASKEYFLSDGELWLPTNWVLSSNPDCYQIGMVKVKKTSICYQIALNGDEFIRKNDEIYLKPSNTRLFDSEYTEVDTSDGKIVYICLEDYLISKKTTSDKNGYDSAIVVLSVVCTLVSIVCLLVSLVIYSCFQDLRNMPGKINMVLIVNLFLAQVSYAFGIGFTENKYLCVATGMIIHLTWLVTVFWMTIACIHMFGVFCSIRAITDRSDGFLLAIYAGCSYSLGVLLVVSNVLPSLVKSGYTDLGYGNDVCFINTKLLLMATFAMPIGIAILLNSVLYGAVVFKINQGRSMARYLVQERNYLEYSIRLSSVTGITWVFGFMFEWTGFWILEYFFVGFTALQGLFIMLSFVFTTKVRRLCYQSNKIWCRGNSLEDAE